ncbi:MAG: hypothetical protein ACO2ZZ_07065 [Cyclobacteriaceae bacterium]
MHVKYRLKDRVNNINDPRLLDELLKAVDPVHASQQQFECTVQIR